MSTKRIHVHWNPSVKSVRSFWWWVGGKVGRGVCSMPGWLEHISPIPALSPVPTGSVCVPLFALQGVLDGYAPFCDLKQPSSSSSSVPHPALLRHFIAHFCHPFTHRFAEDWDSTVKNGNRSEADNEKYYYFLLVIFIRMLTLCPCQDRGKRWVLERMDVFCGGWHEWMARTIPPCLKKSKRRNIGKEWIEVGHANLPLNNFLLAKEF